MDAEVIELIKKKIVENPKKYGKYKNLSEMTDSEIFIIFTSATDDEVQIKKDEKVAKPVKQKSNKGKHTLIEFDNITKTFGKGKKENNVHKGVSFKVYDGETLAVLGANGAGKTVLMETLVRVQKQNSGTITFDFNGLDPFEEIGMQFQDADSNTNLTPNSLIKFIKKMYGEKVIQEQLDEMIEIFGIKPYVNKKIKKLSGGQKQRVNLLLATMHNPKFMILDEFITGLDIISVQDILTYIEKLKKQNDSTLIIISHQPQEIKSLADRIVVLKDGVISAEYTHAEVDKKWNGNFTKFLVENI